MSTFKHRDLLIPNKIYFNQPANSNINKYIVSFDSTETLFSGKKIKIFTDTQKIIIGKIEVKNSTNSEYFINFNNVNNGDFNTFGNFNDTSLITFDNIFDNKYITILDLFNNGLESIPNQYDNNSFEVINEGNNGVITPFESEKLLTTKFEYTNPSNKYLNVNSNIFNQLGLIRLNNKGKYKTVSHIFGFTNKNINIELELSLHSSFTNNINDINGDNFNLKVIKFNTNKKFKNIDLQIKIDRYTDGILDFLDIYCKFDKSKIVEDISSDDLNCRIYHKVDNNPFINGEVFLTQYDINDIVKYNKSTLKYENNVNGVIVENNIFIINDNIYNYTKSEINLHKAKFNNLSDNVDLNNIKLADSYVKIVGNISSIINLPINNITNPFYLIVRNLGEYIIQKFDTFININNNNFVKSYERVFVNNSWSTWIEISKQGHKHNVTDIENLNNTGGTTTVENLNWKNPVLSPNQLATTYPNPNTGWSVFVSTTNSIWCYYNDTWNNTLKLADETSSGLIDKFTYSKLKNQYPISKKILNVNSFVNSLTSDLLLVYGDNLEKIVDKHIDLVPRTTTLTKPLKEFTIQKGWNVNMFGANSLGIGNNINSDFDNNIGIGENIIFNKNNQTIFGKYNTNSDSIFIIGNGSSDIERNNIFEVLNSGITKCSGYRINNGTNNDILTGDGGKISKTALLQTIVNELPSVSTERLLIAPGSQTFTLNWDANRLQNFGRFGDIEVWIKTATNVYNKEVVPITMITEIDNTNQLKAVSYTITLTNNEAMIFIRKA